MFLSSGMAELVRSSVVNPRDQGPGWNLWTDKKNFIFCLCHSWIQICRVLTHVHFHSYRWLLLQKFTQLYQIKVWMSLFSNSFYVAYLNKFSSVSTLMRWSSRSFEECHHAICPCPSKMSVKWTFGSWLCIATY